MESRKRKLEEKNFEETEKEELLRLRWSHRLLNLSSCSLRGYSAISIALNHPWVATLIAYDNDIDYESELWKLTTITALTDLDLSSNDVKSDGAKVLALNTNLVKLDLGFNDIESSGAAAFAFNSTLTHLKLNGNEIDDDGARELARNTTLRNINLGDNSIGSDGAKVLALNSTLTKLCLSNNRIGTDGAHALALTTTLSCLKLNNTGIGEADAKAFALNTTITYLTLSENNIGDEGAKALACNTILTELDLDGNRIGREASMAFLSNTSLTALWVNHSQPEFDKTFDDMLIRNLANRTLRRQEFLCKLAVLTWHRPDDDSIWSRLPGDLRRFILWKMCQDATVASIETTPRQAYGCALFFMANAEEFLHRIKLRRELTIVENRRSFSFSRAFRS